MGPANSTALAEGDRNVAAVFEAFGTTASSAHIFGTHDLAAVLFTDGQVLFNDADSYVYDIVSALGQETGTLPTTVTALLTDWAPLF